MLNNVGKQCKRAKSQQNEVIAQCRDLEDEIKKLSSVIKASGGQVTLCTDVILNKDMLLDVNYESYWFGDHVNLNDSVDQDCSNTNNYGLSLIHI